MLHLIFEIIRYLLIFSLIGICSLTGSFGLVFFFGSFASEIENKTHMPDETVRKSIRTIGLYLIIGTIFCVIPLPFLKDWVNPW